MSTGPTTLPESGTPSTRAGSRWLPRLRDARIRSKLALILVVPVAAVLALATVRLVDVVGGARDADLVRSLTLLSTDVSALTQNLHKERMAAAAYLASPAAQPDDYAVQVGLTDQRITAYTARRRTISDLPPAVEGRLRRIDDHVNALNGTRKEVLDRQQMPVAEAVLRYGVVITDLVAYGEVLGQIAGDGDIADSLRAVAAFARAKTATAEQEAVTFTALSTGQLSDEQYASFVATLTGQQEALVAFSLAATATQQSLVNSTVTGDAVILADQTSTQLSRSVGRPSPITAEDATRSIGAVTDLMRWAEIRLEQALVDEAQAASSAVTRQAVIEAVLVLLTLIVAVALAVMLARSLNRSLRRLREGALSVANRDLPDAVARLRDVRGLADGAAEDIVRQVRDPIRLTNRDEIGQVAQAFNVVHREAVRIAAEQAALRTSVSAMFLNLARRSQALVDRMIGELDQIERAEEDPKRLAQLFELDHLATRMRRNDENLLVLAGADSSPPRREDALLVDALRAAQSEVELYNRVEFGTVDTDISIAANAVNDVVRLIAELLDNATRFSPPNTVVVADGRRIRDYVVVQVEDRGLGMSEEQMAALNRRLAQPPTVDVGAFRLMGLAVVGRLAARYGVRVELRANIEGGTVAQVTLPTSIVVLPRTRNREQLGARTPRAVEPASAVTGGGWPEVLTPALATAGTSTATTETWAGQRGTWPANGRERADQLPAEVAARATGAVADQAQPGQPAAGQPRSGRVPLEQRVPGRSSFAQPTAAGPLLPPAPSSPAPSSAPPPSANPRPAAAPPAIPGRPGVDQRYATPPPPVIAPATDLSTSMASPTAAYPTLHPDPATHHADRTGRGDRTGYGDDAGHGDRTGHGNGFRTGVPAANGGVVPAAVPPLAPVTAPAPPPAPVNGWGAALAAMPPAPAPPPVTARPDDRGEAPIFRAMEAVWFRAHDQPATAEWAMPTAGYPPPPLPGPGDRSTAGMPPGPVAGSGNVGGYASVVAPDGLRPLPYAQDVAGGPGSAYPPAPAVPVSGAPGRRAPDATGSFGDRQPAPHQFTEQEPLAHQAGGYQPAADRPAADRPVSGAGTAGGSGMTTGPGAAGPTARQAADPGRGVGPASGSDGAGDATAPYPVVPGPRKPVEDNWRTAADEGWSRASAAADPEPAGTTRSGLPKRVPQAQLVPGGIKARAGAERARRTPDEVRGLLSAYHRGVQRGRSAGSAEAAGTPSPASEETDT